MCCSIIIKIFETYLKNILKQLGGLSWLLTINFQTSPRPLELFNYIWNLIIGLVEQTSKYHTLHRKTQYFFIKLYFLLKQGKAISLRQQKVAILNRLTVTTHS